MSTMTLTMELSFAFLDKNLEKIKMLIFQWFLSNYMYYQQILVLHKSIKLLATLID